MIKMVKASLIEENPFRGIEFSGYSNGSKERDLVQSIGDDGLWYAIPVRPHPDKPGRFQQTSMHHRLHYFIQINGEDAEVKVDVHEEYTDHDMRRLMQKENQQSHVPPTGYAIAQTVQTLPEYRRENPGLPDSELYRIMAPELDRESTAADIKDLLAMYAAVKDGSLTPGIKRVPEWRVGVRFWRGLQSMETTIGIEKQDALLTRLLANQYDAVQEVRRIFSELRNENGQARLSKKRKQATLSDKYVDLSNKAGDLLVDSETDETAVVDTATARLLLERCKRLVVYLERCLDSTEDVA